MLIALCGYRRGDLYTKITVVCNNPCCVQLSGNQEDRKAGL